MYKTQFELLKKISFVRVGGTADEQKAADILLDELKEMGVTGKVEPFPISCYHVNHVKLEVLEPYKKQYLVTGMGLSGNTPSGGLEAEFIYAEQGDPVSLIDAKGKIVLINGAMTTEKYENLVKANAAGFITFSGTIIDEEDKTDIETRTLRKEHLEFGKIPGVTIRATDAMELVNKKAKKVCMILEQDEGECNSHNIIVEIDGSQLPEEKVLFMAHYDSVPFSPGAYDNGAGSVIIMELLRYYCSNPPKRTVKFIWFGSEERGLLGSKSYVLAHEEELKSIKLGINVDMAGPVLGEEKAIVTADNSLCNMIEYLSKEIGHPITVTQDTYSSDSIPFSDKGVPTVSFARFGAPGGAPGHNRYDLIEHLSSDNIVRTTEFVRKVSEKLINACVFPVPSKMPENMVEAVDKYLKKKQINKG